MPVGMAWPSQLEMKIEIGMQHRGHIVAFAERNRTWHGSGHGSGHDLTLVLECIALQLGMSYKFGKCNWTMKLYWKEL